MVSEQFDRVGDVIDIAEETDDDAWGVSRAQWIEPAIAPSLAKSDDTVLYVYLTPSNRWNGMLYSGRSHISDIVGSQSVSEVETAVRCRDFSPTAVKEFSDVSSLQAEMARLGQLSTYD